MMLLQFATLLSLALLGLAGQHGARLNRIHPHPGALAKRSAGDVVLQKRITSSKWTYYDAETGSAGACGQYIKNTDWAVAMNTDQYGSGYPGPNCFKTLTLTYGGKSAVVTVLDQCPGCPYGGLDLTPSLFAYFASQDKGIIYGEWEYGESASTTSSTTWKAATTTTTKAATTTWKPSSTSTWKPATTSTTKKTTSTTPKPQTTTSTTSTTPSSSHPTSSSTHVVSSSSALPSSASSSASAAGLAAASATPSSAAIDGIEGLNAALLRLGGLIVDGAEAA